MDDRNEIGGTNAGQIHLETKGRHSGEAAPAQPVQQRLTRSGILAAMPFTDANCGKIRS